MLTPTPPFPYFGGKYPISSTVWNYFGDVHHYIEPFAGSLGVLLGRPHSHSQITETVNDKNCLIANFWRALQADSDGVAYWANNPINEADLLARHDWISSQVEVLRENIISNPHYFDVKIAGWWVWGQALWIGDGWCNGKKSKRQMPSLSTNKGIFKNESSRDIVDYLNRLSNRIKRVRVCCGEWKRVLSSAVINTSKPVGIFLDPPYKGTEKVYNEVSLGVYQEVFDWAIEHSSFPNFKIAVCGLDGDYDFPADWIEIPWKPSGGFRGSSNLSRLKERVWFSPNCGNIQLSLFA